MVGSAPRHDANSESDLEEASAGGRMAALEALPNGRFLASGLRRITTLSGPSGFPVTPGSGLARVRSVPPTVYVVVVLVLSACWVLGLRRIWRFLRNQRAATSRIVGAVADVEGGCYVTVAFTDEAGCSQSGRLFRLRASQVVVGAPMRIVYDPANPSIIAVERPLWWQFGAAALAAAAALGCIALLIAMALQEQ
jgi:hypothetical protein